MSAKVALVTGGSSGIGEAAATALLVNDAGYGSYGALEDVPLSEARSQIEACSPSPPTNSPPSVRQTERDSSCLSINRRP
jgi:hypothetical protein